MSEVVPLKLRAADDDDLKIISTFLQDAVIAVNEMIFIKDEARFAFVANRFRWEDADRERPVEGDAIYGRVHCGIVLTAYPQSGRTAWISAGRLKLFLYFQSVRRIRLSNYRFLPGLPSAWRLKQSSVTLRI